MKINFFERESGGLVHPFTAILFYSLISSCVAGVIEKNTINQTQAKSLPNSEKLWVSNQWGPVVKLLQEENTSDKMHILLSPSLSESCARDVYRFWGQVMSLTGHAQKGSNETTVENWALQSKHIITVFFQIG